MKVIAVNKIGLLCDFGDWGVNHEYAEFFVNKCGNTNDSVSLKPFMFNDTIQLDDQRQWLSASAAFWCRAYREAETAMDQAEALGSIRALFFTAGMMGASTVTAQISTWWNASYLLHQLPAPNYSAAKARTGFRSSILNSNFLNKH